MLAILALLLVQTLRTMAPYLAAAAGGALSERSGVVHIGLEGILLASGLGAVVAHVATGSAVVGLLAGMLVGAAMGALHAALVLGARVSAVLSGIALNLLAAGGTRFVLRALYRSSSNSPAIQGFRFADGAPAFVRTVAEPTFWLTLFAAGAVAYLLERTPFGLRVRAVGEAPAAVRSAGLSVTGLRARAVIVGSALCGLGGVALAYDQHQFQSGMSGGRGFIALAAIVLAGWRPARAALFCVLFAGLDAAQVVLQDRLRVAHDLLQTLPYVVTLAALVLASTRRAGTMRPPAALGQDG